ncbi:unnamed protein product [Discosporangium mesarthrocarpum]
MLPGLDRVWARPCPVWKSLSLVLSALCLLHAPGSSTPWPPKPSPDPADHMSGASSISIWPHSRSRSSESLLARTIVGKVDEIGDPHAIITPGAESLKLSHGTTTVAMVFDGGIIVAVDSRASMGSFVGSRTTMKVIPVSDHILGTMAGGAADCTFWLRYLGMQVLEEQGGNRNGAGAGSTVMCHQPYACTPKKRGRGRNREVTHGLGREICVLEETEKRRPVFCNLEQTVEQALTLNPFDTATTALVSTLCNNSRQAKVFEAQNRKPMAVRTAARMLANTLHGYRGQGLSVGTMLMGHDEEGGAQLFYVDNEGARVKGRFFSVGSGSTYAYSVLDVGYRRDMSVQQAAALAQRAVRHATYRDAFSGV